MPQRTSRGIEPPITRSSTIFRTSATMEFQKQAGCFGPLRKTELKTFKLTADTRHNFLCLSNFSLDFESILAYIRYADSLETGEGIASRSI